MRLKIPMTGTVTDFKPEEFKMDNVGVYGDDADPVRPVPLDLGNVSWKLVSIDLENDFMEVEAEAPERIPKPTFDGQGNPLVDGQGKPIMALVPATPAEKQALLDNAKAVLNKTSGELYALTKAKKLVKTPAAVAKYILAKSGGA